MAKFRENHSCAIYEFIHPYDVEQMRKHPDYTEIIEPVPVLEQEVKEAKPKLTKE